MNLNNIRVLLISPLPPPVGGIASWTKQYMNWANNNGLDVKIVNISVKGKRVENINRRANIFEEIIRTISIILKLQMNIVTFKPSVVHLNTSCARGGLFRDYLCAKIAKFHKKKLIIHYHCNIEDQINGRKLQFIILKKLAKGAADNLVLNSASSNYIEKNFGVEAQIIANFIDESFVLSQKKIISREINNISFVGHVRKEKGVFEILHVANYYPNIKFYLAGPVADEIKTMTIPKNIFLLGSISKTDIIALLDKSDIFLFPTYSEGFSNALLEAMARGVPIITTTVGANKDMIEEMGGILVEKNNVSDIKKAIDELFNTNKRRIISEWDIKKVKDNYLINKVMQDLCMIYENYTSN